MSVTTITHSQGGELSKALELCFQLQHYDVLQQIAEELDEDAGQDTVNMVAGYFTEHQQYDKAVQLLVRTGQVLYVAMAHHLHCVSTAIRCSGAVYCSQRTSDRRASRQYDTYQER